MTLPSISTAAVITLWPGSKKGHVQAGDLNPSTFSSLGWDDHTPTQARRVVVDLSRATGFGAGVPEKVARELLDVGAGPVLVQGGRSNVREAFAQHLMEAIRRNAGGGRR